MKKIIIVLLCLFSFVTSAKALTTQEINNPSKTTQELKVLVIEINPILKSITNTSLYSHSGHPKVSEWFGHDVEASINEIKKDVEDASHGYMHVNIVKREYLDEFPRYKKQVKLLNGNMSYSFDEATYIDMGKTSDPNYGNWFQMISDERFKTEDSFGNFDYEYLINKLNLVKRRNNKEFDQVWIFNISPIGTYETMMVGRNSYWINGTPITKDCDNFAIVGLEIARRDTMFHSFGHMTEQILKKVFGQSKDIYNQDVYNISSKTDYNNLNLWEKFALTNYNNKGSLAGVGNTHFTYNGSQDYDYTNTQKVLTNYNEWKNYPNVTGSNFELHDSYDFLHDSINDSIYNTSGQTKANDRLYQRFWFSLLPHITGYTSMGYSNNWWKYFYSLDYVTKVVNNGSSLLTFKKDSTIDVNYTLTYYSNKQENITKIKEGNNVTISHTNVLGFKDGYLYAKGVGRSNVTISYDGKSVTYVIAVEDKKPTNASETITNKPEEPVTEPVSTPSGNSEPITNETPTNPVTNEITNEVITQEVVTEPVSEQTEVKGETEQPTIIIHDDNKKDEKKEEEEEYSSISNTILIITIGFIVTIVVVAAFIIIKQIKARN